MGGSNLMSAIAGRVLLIPKGNYDSTATYTMLDMVVYNGSSYICKQECTGVVPTNTTYWMLNASGSAVAYINDIGDVVITNPTNRQVLMYDNATQKWVNGTISTTLSGLTDTQIASLSNGQVLKYNSTSQKWENADEKGGILPHLIVISETGSTVTVVKGGTTITATETSTGHYECDLTELGTWTIDAILGGDDAQVSLVVDTVKVYTVDDSHFHATVTVKYPDGATCRLQSADETLYATGSPYTFTVHHKETYTITVTYNQRIYTDTVTFTTEGQSFSKTLPSPSEIDVVNDIDTWLWYGDVSGEYSSLEDVMGNHTALATLMASHDAVDYLVRCKDWAINNALIPIMTSNTTPSGVVSANAIYSAGYEAYRAFDRNTSTIWACTAAGSTNGWLQYQFPQATIVKKFFILSPKTGSIPQTTRYKISGSNDGTNFTDLGTFNYTTVSDTEGETNSLNNSTAYTYYRLTVLGFNGNAAISELQFYPQDVVIPENQYAMSYIGLNNYCANTLLADEDWLEGICNSEYFESVLNYKIPTLTSDTQNNYKVTYDSLLTGGSAQYAGWKAFNSSYANGWYSANTSAEHWLKLEIPSAKVIKKVVASGFYTIGPNDIDIQCSADNSTWNNLVSGIGRGQSVNKAVNNSNSRKYYRVHCNANGGYIGVDSIQFYGRADV